MRRALLRLLFGVLLLLAAIGSVGATWQALLTRTEAQMPPPGARVDVGGYRLHLWCTGRGAHTVLLESGLAGGAFEWGFVQPELARDHRVCTYDRAGLGYSEPSPHPRTAGNMAQELALLLERAGISDRIVLVGQSFGGFNARLFATRYRTRVAGLVLVDASHEDQRRHLVEAGLPSGDPPSFFPYLIRLAAPLGLTRALGFGTGVSLDALAPELRPFADATRFRTTAMKAAADEFASLETSAAEVRTTRSVLAVPLVVLSRTRFQDEQFGRAWDAMQEDQVTLSLRGCRLRVANAGHLIQRDQPAAVAAAVRNVIASAEENRSPQCWSTAAQLPMEPTRLPNRVLLSSMARGSFGPLI